MLVAKLCADGEAVTVKLAEAEASGPPTFSGVAYSGGIVSRSTLSKPLDADYIIDLSKLTAGRNVKANLDHKRSQRVGHVGEVENDGRQVKVGGVLSAATEHRDQVAKSAAAGYGWEVSIEASLGKPRKIAADKSEVVNGRTVKGPLYVFPGVLTDVAFVDHGADQGNAITVAASADEKIITLRELREASN